MSDLEPSSKLITTKQTTWWINMSWKFNSWVNKAVDQVPLTLQHWIHGFETRQGSIYKFADNGSNQIQRKKTIVNNTNYKAGNGEEAELKDPADIVFFIDSNSDLRNALSQYTSTDPVSEESMTSSFDHLFLIKRGENYEVISENNCNYINLNEKIVFIRIRKNMKLPFSDGTTQTIKEKWELTQEEFNNLQTKQAQYNQSFIKALWENWKWWTHFIAIEEEWISLIPEIWRQPFDINFQKKSIHLWNKITKLYKRN